MKSAAPPEALPTLQQAQLRYVTNRLPGHCRVRRGHGFAYRGSNGKRLPAKEQKRIRHLAIPPAWKDVWICPYENGHLQATGRDDRGRLQYLYHPDWRTVRDATKFDRLIDFAKALPAIRRKVKRDLRLPELPREKVLAAVVRLLEQTNIRVGNPAYARDNNSFGLSTLRNRHVKVRGAQLRFQFRGKSGVPHRVDFANKRISRIVKRCQDLPGYELFQYINDEGETRDVTSTDVNDYLRECTGKDFTAKDFRTWSGTVIAAELFADAESKQERRTQRTLLRVIDEVAKKLGNTRAVCRRYYIHPAVVAAYRKGELGRWFSQKRNGTSSIRASEKGVVRLLKYARRTGKKPLATQLTRPLCKRR